MLLRPWLGVALLILCFPLGGCRKPVAAPPVTSWDQRAQQAAEAVVTPFVDVRLREYREGFCNGAQMVRTALETGRSPFLLHLSEESAPLMPLGALPAGFTPEGLPLTPEIDAATGLERHAVLGNAQTPFPRGQVEGFAWALSHHGSALLRPLPRPQLPLHWESWSKPEEALRLSGPGSEAQVHWRPGQLLWQAQHRGFPIQRGWRYLPFFEAPRTLALGEDCLWLETQAGQLAAISLKDGRVRDLRSLPEREALRAQARRQQVKDAALEREGYQKDLQKRAEAGDGKAMLALGHLNRGEGKPEAAQRWYRKAAEAGEPDGMIRMAIPLMDASARHQDRAEARRWIEKAAKAGSPEAQTYLELLDRQEKALP